MLNKPEGYVSTARDQFGRPTVLDLVKEIKERVYPSEGLTMTVGAFTPYKRWRVNLRPYAPPARSS